MWPRASSPFLARALRELRWQLLGYGLGIAAASALYTLLYPAFEDTLVDLELPQGLSAFFGAETEFATLRGYLQVELFSLWVPLLLAIYAVVAATSQLAGDEQSGRLELVLAQPVSRRRLFLARAAAVLAGIAVMCATTSLALLVSWPLLGDTGGLALWQLLASPFALLPFGFVLVALSLLAGALATSRGQAAGVMTVLVAAFYLADALRDLVPSLDWLAYATPFFYGGTKRVLVSGVVPWHLGLLLASTMVLLWLALRAFEAREIGTGRSPLRLPRLARAASTVEG